MTDLILALRQHDSDLSNALPASVAEMLLQIPSLRNKTIHEMRTADIQARTARLITLIDAVLSHEPFAHLLVGFELKD